MDINILVATISAITSVLVTIISQMMIASKNRRFAKEKEVRSIQKQYINPLRFFLAENYFRIHKAVDKCRRPEDEKTVASIIADPVELLDKDLSWFAGNGCYLISNCYFTACLLAMIEQIRVKIPYLRLSIRNDTRMMSLINKIVIDFRYIANVYYVIQMTIGRDVYLEDEQRLLTYREFCLQLQNSESLVWYRTLVWFYITNANWEEDKITGLLEDLKELSDFLDRLVCGGNTINQKMKSEKDAGLLKHHV